MKTFKNVDDYIKNAPKEVQTKLKELREIIKKAAPEVEEKISYSIPYYGYKGRVAYFRLAKNHIGLYVVPPIIEEFKKEVGDYYATKATLHLPLDRKLPTALIKKLIKARIKYNDESKR